MEINWKCHKCGHEWKVYAKNRAIQNTGCFACKRRWNTSFHELLLLYYFKELFGTVESGYNPDIESVKEVVLLQ
ncbi:zinc-ribbon domain-containing protein [Bacillus solitudinis]|uniref:zinc-ribbon domain-containing protein n=1 Tax=Bacillus solitudinis TaxID=2014074 RepID=UPI0012FDE047